MADFSDLGGTSVSPADFSDLGATPADSPPPSLGSRILGGIGKGLQTGLETLAAPFQAVGEAVRVAGEGGPMRAPSIIQRLFPSTATEQPPADPFTKAYQGLEGIANLPSGLDKAVAVITGQPDFAAKVGGMAMAAGTGEPGNAPMTATMKVLGAPGKAVGRLLGDLASTGEIGNIPGSGEILKKAAGVDAVPIGFENLTKPAIPEILRTSQETGVPITSAGLTGSATQSQLEAFLSRFPFSSDVMQEFHGNQLAKLGELRDTALPIPRSADEIGTDLQNAFAKKSQDIYKATQDAYSQVGALAGNDPIALSNTQKVAAKLLQDQTALNDLGAQSGAAVPMLQKLANIQREGEAVPVSVDYPTLQGLWRKLNANIAQADASYGVATPGMKFMSSPEAGIYKQIKSALRNDLDAYSAGNPDFKTALTNADDQYGTFKDLFKNNKFIQGIVRNQNPSAVINQAVQLDNPKAMNILQAVTPPDLMQELKIRFLRDMGESTPGNFSPSKFASQYQKIGDSKLGDFLGEPLMQAVRPLYLMSRATQTAEKLGGNPSETGRMMMTGMGLTAPLMAVMKGHPLMGAGIFAGEMGIPPLIAKGYLSSPATKFLSRQTGMTTLPARTLGISRFAGPILGMNPSEQNRSTDFSDLGAVPAQ